MVRDTTLNSDNFNVVNLAKISVAEFTSLKGTNCLSADAILVIFLLYSKNVSARDKVWKISQWILT